MQLDQSELKAARDRLARVQGQIGGIIGKAGRIARRELDRMAKGGEGPRGGARHIGARSEDQNRGLRGQGGGITRHILSSSAAPDISAVGGSCGGVCDGLTARWGDNVTAP